MPRVLAIHTTEGIMRAADLRAWTSWPGSSHAAADETGVLLAGADDGFVDYSRAAWTLRSGNPWSENIELCGFAKWKRADWLARPKLLDACARWLADRSVARGIPLVKLSAKDYAKGASGVIGHVDHTVGYSDGTHWDPGPEFPYDVVLEQARAYVAGKTKDPSIPAPLSNLGDDDMATIAVRNGDHFDYYVVGPTIGAHYEGSPTQIAVLEKFSPGGKHVELDGASARIANEYFEAQRQRLVDDIAAAAKG